jgi:outer membrane protein
MKIKNLIIIGVIIAVVAASILFFKFPYDNLMAQDDAEGRIAYVDIMRVYEGHPEKKNAEAQLSEIAKNMETELKEKAESLSEDKQQDILKSYQEELTNKEQEMIQQILNQITETIQKVAQEKKVKLVMEKQNVIYGGYDMTQDVIEYIENDDNNDDEQKINIK